LYLADKNNEKYVSALILKIKSAKNKIDIRLVSGETIKNVDQKRLFVLNFDIGTKIEARYKGGTVFYRGVILSVRETGFGLKTYNVQYEDGETENDVASAFIRISPSGFEALMRERKTLLAFHSVRERRLAHINDLKEARLVKVREKAELLAAKFNNSWNNALEQSRSDVPGGSLRSMIQIVDPLRSLQYSIKCRVYYTKGALRFGFVEEKVVGKKKSGDVCYVNYSTNERQNLPPVYTAEEHVACRQIQGIWLCYQSRKRMLRLLLQDSISSIVRGALTRYQSEAFIGYGMEGVTPLYILRRAGYWEVADAIQLYFQKKQSALQEITIEKLVAVPQEKYDTLGVVKHSDVKSFQKFQDWYNKTNELQRNNQLAFLNYYNDVYDPRTITQCIQQSEPLILQRVLKAFRNSASRAQSIAKEIVTSTYPISKMQLDSFLHAYNGKPGIALV
jgi:hypothetical protein